MRRALKYGLILCWGLTSLAMAEPAQVLVPSLDQRAGQPVQMPGFWFAGSSQKSAPAFVLLHGCGGMYGKSGKLSQKMQTYAAALNAQDIGVLVIDSLTPRGEKDLCTQRIGTRQVTMTQRRRDALGALQWLKAQAGVDPSRLGLMGWSNGGSTVLAATNRTHPEVKAAAVTPSLAIAFYPGCEADLKRGYDTSASLLIMIGEADDWTPAPPCQKLASQTHGPQPQIDIYPGAYHGFDSTAAVRLRKDVPNGQRPGEGVHMGGNAAAYEASKLRVNAFLHAKWGVSPR